MVSTSREPQRIARMFDAIAGRYDVLNHILSAGMDWRWRRRAIRALGLTGNERLLDVCTGTADLALEAVSGASGRARAVVGVDFAGEMLKRAQEKVRAKDVRSRVTLVRGDATQLPFADASFDALTIAFGIRNVVDPLAACREFSRVLRPGGRIAILEFGMPRIPGIRAAYRWYFRTLLPRVGGLVSKHDEAYSYLPASVDEFPERAAFADALGSIGFSGVSHQALSAGIVTLFVGTK